MYVELCDMSCGVYQLIGLEYDKKYDGPSRAQAALAAIADYGSIGKSGYTILFSDNIERGHGQALFEELKKAKVGRVKSWGRRINPNHGSTIEIWEWRINKKAANRVNKLEADEEAKGAWEI